MKLKNRKIYFLQITRNMTLVQTFFLFFNRLGLFLYITFLCGFLGFVLSQNIIKRCLLYSESHKILMGRLTVYIGGHKICHVSFCNDAFVMFKSRFVASYVRMCCTKRLISRETFFYFRLSIESCSSLIFWRI